MPSVQVIDPRLSPAWDEFVAQQAEGSIFHSTAWARVLLETYRYQPRYYVLTEASGGMLAGVPLLLVSSRLTAVNGGDLRASETSQTELVLVMHLPISPPA